MERSISESEPSLGAVERKRVAGGDFLDDDEATGFAGRAASERDRRRGGLVAETGMAVMVLLFEQAPGEGDPVLADSIGKKTEMTDADETLGQDVEQEASNELEARDLHGPVVW